MSDIDKKFLEACKTFLEKERREMRNDNLVVGDIVTVHNPLLKPEHSKYPVIRIEGNKAVTKFRNFNRRIYYDRVYEFGKRYTPYGNDYTVDKVK